MRTTPAAQGPLYAPPASSTAPSRVASSPRDVELVPAASRSWLLRVLDRFGQEAPLSPEQQAHERAFRAQRQQELGSRFDQLVAAADPMESSLRRLHAILNHDKQWHGLHRIGARLLSGTYRAGSYRRTPQRADAYLCPLGRDVAPLMRAFGARLDTLVAAAGDDAQARLVAAWSLTMMIRIHPFMDGNGRTARALINLILARSGESTVEFPSDSEAYRRSAVWQGFKSHMRGFVGALGWSARDGSIPPAGYYANLRDMLMRELDGTTLEQLAARPDIVAIADALATERQGSAG